MNNEQTSSTSFSPGLIPAPPSAATPTAPWSNKSRTKTTRIASYKQRITKWVILVWGLNLTNSLLKKYLEYSCRILHGLINFKWVSTRLFSWKSVKWSHNEIYIITFNKYAKWRCFDLWKKTFAYTASTLKHIDFNRLNWFIHTEVYVKMLNLPVTLAAKLVEGRNRSMFEE